MIKDPVTVAGFTFDLDLVKGWYIDETIGSFDDEARAIRNCVVLYDCFQIPVQDDDRELETYLTERLVQSKARSEEGFRLPRGS